MNFLKVRVQSVSLTAMEEAGWELSDEGRQQEEFFAGFNKNNILSCLTFRQRQILFHLVKGMERKEIARHMAISLQAIHQIIPRMRKRLAEKAGVVWKK